MRIFTILLLFIGTQIHAANYESKLYFNHLSVDEGLSQNLARAITQDYQGFIWIGTKDGLNRFDGSDVRIFRHEEDNPKSIGCNYISSLLPDTEKIMWVGTEKGLYRYYPEKEKFELFDKASSGGAQITGEVVSVKKDSSGRIWIAEIRGGLFCYDPSSDTLRDYPYSKLFNEPLTIRCLEIDKDGNVWLGDFGHGLMRLSRDRKKLVVLKKPGEEEPLDYVNTIVRGPENSLIIGYWGCGVKRLNLDNLSYETILEKDENGKGIFCRVLSYSNDGILYIGGESGLFTHDLNEMRLTNHIQASKYERFSLSDRAIHALFVDDNNGIWVGTYYGGVDYCQEKPLSINRYYPKGLNNSLSGRRVHQFCSDPAGKIWISTSDGGLNIFNPEDKSIEFFEPSKDFLNIPCLCLVGDEIWAGTNTNGIIVIDPANKTIKRQYNKGTRPGTILDNSVFSITSGENGNVYIGSYLGMQRYDFDSGSFITEEGIPPIYISVIFEDSQNTLWVGTSKGVYQKRPRDKDWNHFNNDIANPGSLPSDKIKSIFEDSRGNIWIMTNGAGFCKYLPESNSFKTYNNTSGLPNNVVFRMEEDLKGTLWLSTNLGLVSFDPDKEAFTIYTIEDGLLSNQFNDRSSFRAEDGTLYFGCIEGFISFNPSEIKQTRDINVKALISDFAVQGNPVEIEAKGSPLDKSISFQKEIVLSHSQNSFSFKVCTFDYFGSLRKRFICHLDGTDEEWRYLKGTQEARYSGLKAGHYKFIVKDASTGEQGKELTSLGITIRPPWYASTVAKIAYLLFIALSVVSLYFFLKRRNESLYKTKIKEMERESERELYESKLKFFTNIAHEIRTPLTLINGPLDSILTRGPYDDETSDDLSLMKNNTAKLLSLINQLLDFRKVEYSGVKTKYGHCNVSKILREISYNFQYSLKGKNIDYSIDLPEEDVYAILDAEALKTIVTNLISNGIKYAKGVLNLSLESNEESVVIRTRNDGRIIPEDMREYIFQPFARIDSNQNQIIPGTGIGLTYSRLLAEAQNGTLIIENDSKWNVFKLEIPLNHEITETINEEEPETIVNNVETSDKAGRRYTIMLVEDQRDMLEFERRVLSSDYNIVTATNGLDAMNLLELNKIDLIISDVIMPDMDGFELCETTKTDIRYSHIPIILLTAKTDDISKISGFNLGADSYIEKPFSMDMLKAAISSLLTNRENIRKAYLKSPLLPVASAVISQTDKDFIEKVNGIIINNYSNVDFRMDDMASMLNMSRATFYRKIQGVLDMTPNDFLKLTRLKQAATLLRQKEYRISEVCYMTGFNSPSYFSRCFLKQFGLSPKEFMESCE